MKTGRPPTNEFLPRICFLDESRCSGCQRCQHTFYCDAFLDRVDGGVLPPLFDNRNCSGCGLCVQVCDSGALHLYHPEEMLVMVSASRERREILRGLRISFLIYHPEQDLECFVQKELRRLAAVLAELPDSRRLQQLLEEIWEIRLQDRFVLGHGKTGLYPDLRQERRSGCLATANRLLEIQATLEHNGAGCCRLLLDRAAVWSQLIWSDPGQVLWDSLILLLQTFLEEEDDSGWTRREDIPVGKLDPDGLKPGKCYRISSYVVLLRQGKLLLADWVPGRVEFTFSGRIFANPDEVRAYNEQGMGRGRLAGLDLRSCGSFLVEDFHAIGNEDLFAMAGLPWQGIGELLENNSEALKVYRQVSRAIPARDGAR